MVRRNDGGIWHVKMLSDIGWCGIKKGEVVEVPSRVTDSIAHRWLEDGAAELCEGPKVAVSNKAVGRAKAAASA